MAGSGCFTEFTAELAAEVAALAAADVPDDAWAPAAWVDGWSCAADRGELPWPEPELLAELPWLWLPVAWAVLCTALTVPVTASVAAATGVWLPAVAPELVFPGEPVTDVTVDTAAPAALTTELAVLVTAVVAAGTTAPVGVWVAPCGVPLAPVTVAVTVGLAAWAIAGAAEVTVDTTVPTALTALTAVSAVPATAVVAAGATVPATARVAPSSALPAPVTTVVTADGGVWPA